MMHGYKITVWKDKKLLIVAIVFLIMVMGWILYASFGHQLIEAMYEGRSVGFLNRIISERVTTHPVAYYLDAADRVFLLINVYLCLILISFSLVICSVHINLALLILSFMGMGLVFICTSRYGVGVSADSTVYISVARNLLSGYGYLGWWGGPLIVYTPLFPTILAILGLAGIDPLEGARVFNAVVFGLIIFTSGQLFRISLRSRKLVILGAISVLASTAFLGVSVMAWSEPLFILLAVLSIIFLQKFLIEKRWVVLLLFSIVVSFACLQRYAGVALVLTGVFSIIFFLQGVSFLQKLKYGITFCVISMSPFLFWIMRNYMLTQTFFGPSRFPSRSSLLDEISYAFYIFVPWLTLGDMPFLVIVIGTGTILLMAATMFFFRQKNKGLYANELIKILPVGLLVLISMQILINGVANIRVEINGRFLSTVYFCILFLILVSVENISNLLNQSRRNAKWINSVGTVVFVLWLVYSFSCSFLATSAWSQSGVGFFNSALWRESPLIEWLQMNPLDGAIYSNAPDALYIRIEKKDKFNFRRYQYMLPKSKGDDLRQLKELLKANNKTYFVWFKYAQRESLCDIQDLRSVFVLKEVVALPDGAVYLFE